MGNEILHFLYSRIPINKISNKHKKSRNDLCYPKIHGKVWEMWTVMTGEKRKEGH